MAKQSYTVGRTSISTQIVVVETKLLVSLSHTTFLYTEAHLQTLMARPNEESEVIGHYLVPAHGRPAQPLLHESTVIFQDVVSDKLSTVEVAVEADAGKLNQFFLILHWASDVKGGTGPGLDSGAEVLDANAAMAKASVMVKQRTLLMIAAHAGSLRVLSYLLSRGAEPSRKSPDGLTAYDVSTGA